MKQKDRAMLLIVDPQVDFVAGSLKVPGAEKAMSALAEHIDDAGAGYAACVITADWHPAKHMSFRCSGGEWPRHCVAYSIGAAIYPPVYDSAMRSFEVIEVLTKGQDQDKEEYSIFANEESAAKLCSMIKDLCIDRIDICGVAGDVCVSRTLEDGIARFGKERFNVLTRYSPSLDGGETLKDIISKYNLKCDL